MLEKEVQRIRVVWEHRYHLVKLFSGLNLVNNELGVKESYLYKCQFWIRSLVIKSFHLDSNTRLRSRKR